MIVTDNRSISAADALIMRWRLTDHNATFAARQGSAISTVVIGCPSAPPAAPSDDRKGPCGSMKDNLDEHCPEAVLIVLKIERRLSMWERISTVENTGVAGGPINERTSPSWFSTRIHAIRP